jgi:cytochrome P450
MKISSFTNEHDEGQGFASYRANVLIGNPISAIVAGSDTTRATLISILYYLINHPYHIMVLQEELSGIEINKDLKKLAILPHFNAVVKDTSRLAPPVMTDGSHKTGVEGS